MTYTPGNPGNVFHAPSPGAARQLRSAYGRQAVRAPSPGRRITIPAAPTTMTTALPLSRALSAPAADRLLAKRGNQPDDTGLKRRDLDPIINRMEESLEHFEVVGDQA